MKIVKRRVKKELQKAINNIDADQVGKSVDVVVDKLEDAIDKRIKSDKTDAKQDARLTKVNNFLKAVAWGTLVSTLIKGWRGLENKTFSKVFKFAVIGIMGAMFNTNNDLQTQVVELTEVNDSIITVVDSTLNATKIVLDSTTTTTINLDGSVKELESIVRRDPKTGNIIIGE
jgi:ribosomal protein S20